MDIQHYQQRLRELETRLSSRATRERQLGREQRSDVAGDAGDASVTDESESEDFTEAELDVSTLQQVRDALDRIDAGAFGLCAVDGEPIEPKRLDAVPWTPYCAKHAQALEAASPQKTPSS
jgi:RNA polymerase-binding transcription factor